MNDTDRAWFEQRFSDDREWTETKFREVTEKMDGVIGDMGALNVKVAQINGSVAKACGDAMEAKNKSATAIEVANEAEKTGLKTTVKVLIGILAGVVGGSGIIGGIIYALTHIQ